MSGWRNAYVKTQTIWFITNISMSSSFIFIPNLARDLGASEVQIGLIGAAYGGAVFFSSSIFGRASDVYSKKLILSSGLLLAAIFFGLQSLATFPPLNTPFALMFLRFAAGFCGGIFPPALIVYGYEYTRKVGSFTSWGSLGWAIGNLIAGIIGIYSGIFLLGSVFFIISFFIALSMPESETHLKISSFPKVLKKNFGVYLAYFLRHVGMNAILIIFPLYLLELNATLMWIGILYSFNSGTQVLVLRFVDRFRSFPLIMAGLALSTIAFIIFSSAHSFYHIIPGQFALGGGWACLLTGSLKFLMDNNEEKATATGLLNSTIYAAAVIGPILGGIISELFGFRSIMHFAAIITAIAFILYGFERKRFAP